MSSLKSNTRTVSSRIWKVSTRFTDKLFCTAISSASETETIDAATLVSVFPMRIVINNLLGYKIRLLAYLNIIPEDLKSSSNFFFFNEKKATSDAEKKAENNSRITSASIL